MCTAAEHLLWIRMKGQYTVCTCTSEVQHHLIFAEICVHVSSRKSAREYTRHRNDTLEQTSVAALHCSGNVNRRLWCLALLGHAWLH